jgi:hypothetical protein
MAELFDYVLEPLREGADFTLFCGRRRGDRTPVLGVALAGQQPSSEGLRRLEHEYSLAAELDPGWAATRRTGRPIDTVPQETMDALLSYDWPGNIRELQNLIERAVILSNDGVLPNPLPPAEIKDRSILQSPSTLKENERDLILRALEDRGWMVGGSNGAAAKLGVKRTTLIAKMQKFGLSRPVVN